MNDEAMTKGENERYEFFAKKFTEEELSYRETIPCLPLSTIVGAIAGTIYSMHPFGVAHGVSKICNEIQRVLRMNEEALHPEFSYKKIGLDFECLEHVKPADLLTFLDRELKKIPEFENLNLSLNEKRMNIRVDDPNRNQFLFTSRLSTTARENDFIDLDACIRNIYYEILLHDMEDLTAPIRNMRYFNNPQITGQMEIAINTVESKTEKAESVVIAPENPIASMLGVKLRYVESVIAEELYRHRADCPGIKEFGMTVQDIIDEFLHFAKSYPDEDIHDYGHIEDSYWRFHSWSNIVVFSGKLAVLDFLSNLCIVPQFVHLTKATKTVGSTMITRMVYHLMEIATKYQDADIQKEG